MSPALSRTLEPCVYVVYTTVLSQAVERGGAAPYQRQLAPPRPAPPICISSPVQTDRRAAGSETGGAGAGAPSAHSPAAPAFVVRHSVVEVMMAAAVERGGVRAAFLNPSSGGGGGGSGGGGGGGPAPTALPTGALSGAVVLGSGSMPVPMNLFATWEIDRSSPSCVPR